MIGVSTSLRWCANVMRRNAKSFYLSTRFLPKDKREAIEALYGFFRHTDDAADEGAETADARRATLDAIRRDLALLDDHNAIGVAPWFAALRRTVERYPIDRSQLLRIVAGCESDLGCVRVESLAELERYAGSVAGSVGRCVLPVLGAHDPDSLVRSERLGIAMQLTNVLRDVEDDRAMGRIYLPTAQFPGKPIPAVMRIMATRAREYYREAPVLAARLPNDGSRAALLIAAVLYERVLDRLEERGFDPLGGRVFVSELGKLRLAARCMFASYTGLANIR
jgi:phytoene/squalene synthetase